MTVLRRDSTADAATIARLRHELAVKEAALGCIAGIVSQLAGELEALNHQERLCSTPSR